MEIGDTAKLAIALLLIAAAILYLESAKPASPSPQAGGQQGSAPELAGIAGYINAPSNLTIASLRGKVVLVDFWAYSCINCIRTFPYLESWHEKYSGYGLVIIGVHSPEFGFEKDYGNVKAAVEKFGIKYPVVLDNSHSTWDAFHNQYWPHGYLIDAKGNIRFDHIGEGGYNETEQQIVQLLSEAKGQAVPMNSTAPNATGVDFGRIQTPEIYFGDSYRRAPLGNAPFSMAEGAEFNATIPAGSLEPNTPYLEGAWINGADAMQLAGGKGAVELAFTAKNVNMVAGSQNGTSVSVFLDGDKAACADLGSGACAIREQRLYSLVVLPGYGAHTLRIEANGSGLELYTFTFG
ncbi:Thiol-disulfide oxidoreductase ResA [uncultured archaeon]|nr:Thiol-disulfide oxidoreductase ResA [uncultured archaeon]